MRLALLGAVLIALSGCGQGAVPPHPSTAPRDESRVSMLSGGARPYDEPADHLTADGKGTLRTYRGTRKDLVRAIRVPVATFARLRDQLRSAGFTSIPTRLRDEVPAQDAVRYRLAFAGHVVHRDRTNPPRELAPVVNTLTDLMRSARGTE